MTLLLLSTVFLGIMAGKFVIPIELAPALADYAQWLLLAVLFGIGLELGASSSLVERLRRLQPKSLLLPLTSAVGTLLGALLAAVILRVRPTVGLSIGAGFGWYSLSSVIIAEILGAEAAALAFLTNVIRELVAIPLIPILSKLGLGIVAIVPGGATTMDTTLAVISRVTDEETTIVAFYHGVTLSLLVPILVPLFAKM